MRLRITKIEERASERPPGYVQAVLARGVIDGDWLEISSEALGELRATYRPPEVQILAASESAEPDLPPIGVMAGNLGRAAVAEVQARFAGVPPITAEEVARRQLICSGQGDVPKCENYRSSDERCALCGCVMDFKTRLRSQHCPIEKW